MKTMSEFCFTMLLCCWFTLHPPFIFFNNKFVCRDEEDDDDDDDDEDEEDIEESPVKASLLFCLLPCGHLFLSLILFIATGQSDAVQTETSSSEWEESEAHHPCAEAGDILTFFFLSRCVHTSYFYWLQI